VEGSALLRRYVTVFSALFRLITRVRRRACSAFPSPHLPNMQITCQDAFDGRSPLDRLPRGLTKSFLIAFDGRGLRLGARPSGRSPPSRLLVRDRTLRFLKIEGLSAMPLEEEGEPQVLDGSPPFVSLPLQPIAAAPPFQG
jgi:hypothetical protein